MRRDSIHEFTDSLSTTADICRLELYGKAIFQRLFQIIKIYRLDVPISFSSYL